MTHRAARVENAVTAALDKRLRGSGFTPRVVPFTGYGGPGWARILARVVLVPPGSPRAGHDFRGWRRFAISSASEVEVRCELGGSERVLVSDRDGYLDVRVELDEGSTLDPGWQAATLTVDGAEPMIAPVRVVGPGTRLAMVSDLDDTVIVTMLPRPLVAFRNAFLVRESDRRPVRGMAQFYREVLEANPDTFVVYLSTGAWNTATPMTRFLDRHDYPPGPLLMTDWGPTEDAWFRSGQRHKREQLRRLFAEFPELRWLLVGDDGQHDPVLYGEAAREFPDRVHAIAIREVPLGERVTRADPTSMHLPGAERPHPAVEVRAPDGLGLRDALAARGLLVAR